MADDSGAGTGDAADDSCPECGQSHEPDAVFCSACGAALD
jgi:uncharacterized OB-fold protein